MHKIFSLILFNPQSLGNNSDFTVEKTEDLERLVTTLESNYLIKKLKFELMPSFVETYSNEVYRNILILKTKL